MTRGIILSRSHSSPDIIGLGTWYDKAAAELIEREKKLGRSLDLIRTESGLGASGIPHIGSLADVLRNHAVAEGVRLQGYNAELIAFSDDKDGLRKVPAGLPDEMEKWLGYPVSSIPDVLGDCHDSFGAHITSLLLEAVDISGADYKLIPFLISWFAKVVVISTRPMPMDISLRSTRSCTAARAWRSKGDGWRDAATRARSMCSPARGN